MMTIDFEKVAPGLEKNERIYRYMKIDRFFEYLRNDEDLFSIPLAWADFDPFEDLLSKVESIKGNAFNITGDLFAQCWNRGLECDGMWKNYTTFALDDGVMITSSVDVILSNIFSLLYGSEIFSNDSIFQERYDIEKTIESMFYATSVNYLPVDEIVNRYECYFGLLDCMGSGSLGTMDSLPLSFTKIAKLLSIKRMEYSYEKELRIFLQFYGNIPKGFNTLPGRGLLMPGFKNRVMSVAFSPKVSAIKFNCYRETLVKDFGFSQDTISRSNMYDLNSILRISTLNIKK